MQIRLLPFETADGASNMATDEALLHTAAEAGVATLRFYAWQPATLSLGYFQPAAVRLGNGRLESLAWVRRPSGGATLVHDRELTYCLALPPGVPWQTGEPWPRRMHRIIVAALHELGFVQPLLAPAPHRHGDVLCFQQQTPDDVLCAGHKIVGSAQRKYRRALLQHGSVLLAKSSWAPELPGLLELTGSHPTCMALQAAIVAAFERDTGWLVRPDHWLVEESGHWYERRDKYLGREWNMKR